MSETEQAPESVYHWDPKKNGRRGDQAWTGPAAGKWCRGGAMWAPLAYLEREFSRLRGLRGLWIDGGCGLGERLLGGGLRA